MCGVGGGGEGGWVCISHDTYPSTLHTLSPGQGLGGGVVGGLLIA